MSWMKQGLVYCRPFIARIPLFGRLYEVPEHAIRQACYETLTTVLFATMPFWILPALGHFIFNPKPSVGDGLEDGEGLIYAAALLGPLFYVLTRRYGKWALRWSGRETLAGALSVSFPYGTLFAAITAFTCVISGFAFAVLQRESTVTEIDPGGIQTLSWILVLGSTVIFFLITAYRNMLDDLDANRAEVVIEEQPKSEDAFLGDWLRTKR